MASPTLAATTSLINLCPLIYYEEPYNRSIVLPASCPPNEATRSLSGQSQLPILVPGLIPINTVQPLLPPVDLPVPLTVTFLRPDAGFVRVTMASEAGSGVLMLMLDEATSLSDGQTSIRVQSNGNVLVY